MYVGGNDPDERLEHRLRAARDRYFCGRAAELELFRSALRHGPDSFAVLFLHGPGGIGKSALLRRFADEAHAAGRRVVELDGRSVEPSPAAFEAEAGAALVDDKVVLLVDTFELCAGLEGWLRDRFLPRVRHGVLVVLAGRRAPDPDWRGDPAWIDVLKVVPLGDLLSADARALLDARRVPAELHQTVLTFAGGHPLALSLAAEVAAGDAAGSVSWAPTRDVIDHLLGTLVGEVPTPLHRQALEICAHARETTEELLRAVLPHDSDTNAMFAWLARLPYVEAGRHGLFPHDVVRDALEADLRWRDPAGYAAMHRRLRAHLLSRARAATGRDILPAMGAFNYLRRHGGVMSYLYGSKHGEVFEEPVNRSDRAVLLELAARTRWADSTELVAYWLERQPEAFRSYRRSRTGELVAFLAWLRLTDADAAAVSADPVVAAAWSHANRAGVVRAGEHVAVARFMVYCREQRPPSPVHDLFQQRILANMLHSKGLAWSYMVTAAPDYWEPIFNYVDYHRADTATQDTGGYALFGHDWLAVPLETWLDVMESWELFGLPATPDAREPECVVMARPEFDIAVRDALATRRLEALATNPLMRSRMVMRSSRSENRAQALRSLVSEAVESLRISPREMKLHRVLVATFFDLAATREAAARKLNLPLSTYHRHLRAGIQQVCDRLWDEETRDPADR
jgi:hypothetical protein